MPSHFEGGVEARWLVEEGDDRKTELLSDFAFVHSSDFRWEDKPGDVIDGVSIPELVWSEIVGTPYIGDYRRVSVIHDVACDAKIMTSRDAHWVFYEVMLVDGTSQPRALMFHTAVRLFGPQWEDARGPSNLEFKADFLRSGLKRPIDIAELEAALDAVSG